MILKKNINKIIWRKKNGHNYTRLINIEHMDKVEVGNFSYGGLDMEMTSGNNGVKIGHFCSIAKHVYFIPCSDHPVKNISTYPFKTMLNGLMDGKKEDAISKGNIVIDDDVWIGYGVTILSGVHIGQGAVITAGAVVSKDIPPYAIAGGVPAKVIKYRFSKELIDELLKVDFGKLDREMIIGYKKELYKELTNKKQLAWLPKKHD